MPVFAATIIAVGVTLALTMGPRPVGGDRAQAQVILLLDAFALTHCPDLAPVGSMFANRGATYQRVSGYEASGECLALLETAATERGFRNSGDGRYELGAPDGAGEILLFYPRRAGGAGSFEWERHGNTPVPD